MHIKMSDQIDKLAPALVAAVAKIKPVAKDSSNPQFRSKYADLSSCLEEAREALASEGLCVMQPPVTHLHGTIPTSQTQGEIEYHDPVVMVSTIILHTSGQWIAGEISLPHLDAGKFPMAQAIGSAITYLRRYSLCAMLSIPTEDDDGEAAMGRGGSNGGYARQEDRRPVNGNGSHQPRQAPPARGNDGPANRIADAANRQPPARTTTARPAPSLDGVPIDESFGDPPSSARR